MLHLQYFPDSGTRGRREGTGSTEATEMILNNLFYITAKVSRLYIHINSLLNFLTLSLSLSFCIVLSVYSFRMHIRAILRSCGAPCVSSGPTI